MNHSKTAEEGRTNRSKKGFSLVELLVVMTIIAVLLSVASVGISNIGKGQGLTAGLSLGEGMLNQARNLAMNQNSTARLIIHYDLNDAIPEERDRYLRMMMVVYRELDPETGEEKSEWIRVGQPVFLPNKIYYSPQMSLRDMTNGGEMPTDRHQLTSKVDDTHQCVYYEFNGQGICSTPGAGFVLVNGVRPVGREIPVIGDSKAVKGFAVMRNGSTSMIRDVDRIYKGTN